jgi:hypothetical protein
MHLDREIRGFGRLSAEVMWHADVTQGDVDP